MSAPRVLAFDGIHNFRDYGGYVADGGRIRTGVLYRSAQHKDATAADLESVARLGLGTVIDLRGDSERAQAPCPRPADFAAQVLFAEGETVSTAAPHIEAGQVATTAARAHAAMTALYTLLPFRPVLVAVMRDYFAAIAARDTPSLIHCVAGKDRTGVAVAVLHRLLGVHADDVMADYLLTNTAGDVEARLAAGARHIRERYGDTIDDDAMRTMMSVSPEYLDTAFAAIDAHRGGFDGYAADVLGVTPAMRAEIAARLIV
jgi:protein tyrosine/serine phosphatase